MGFERVDSEGIWSGQIASVRRDRFRHEDGDEVEREIVGHPGAVAVVAHDGERVWMVAQPREAVEEQALLELPAGKLDAEGEDALATAKRELAEEIGKSAQTWERLTGFWSSPGFSDEWIEVYLATDLEDASAESEENERISIRPVPLGELDAVIEDCRDAKSLVGLLWLKAFVAR
jgi:ADP-ribose pyrophosphatase